MRVMVIGSKTICRKSYKSQKPVNGSVIYVVYLCNDVHGIACGSFWINSTVCKPEDCSLSIIQSPNLTKFCSTI